MPFAKLRPFDFGPAHRRGMLLGALAFAIAASLGLAASWFLSLQVPLYAAAGSRSADFGHLLLGVSTLAWTMAATVAWIIIRGQRQQIALLAESRERNRAIVDNMVDGAIHIDGDGRLVALNSAAERIFHWYSAELRDKPLTTLLATCSHGQMEGVLHDQITESPNQDPSSRTHEVIGRRRDGTEFPLYLAISEVKTGGYPVLTAIARDLTDTHRQMAELAEARDQAMAADRAKSQFLAVMSHEIRTPMNGILGMLELLRDGSLSQQQQDFLDTAEKSSTMLLSIINDILDLSKIEAGKLDLQEIEFDLRASVEEVTALVASNARDKLIEVASFVERDVPNQVRGDPYRIRQVLLNLMGNAVKFTQAGEVVAHVSVKQDGEHGLVVRVQVRDTGIGIEPEVAEKLFQPFTQADASTTRRFGGTGLGLVISKRLVNLMGGEIGVDSTANEGSTFWFTVRLARSESPPQRTERDLRTARVLIVDDNATNRLILESYLRNWGAETESVDSGRAAIFALQRAIGDGQPFGLAILDMQMPEMDGIELAQRIKGDSSLQETRLLMLSSLGYPGEDARRAGIGVSLLKPVRQSLLHDAALKVLGMPRPAAAIPAPRRNPPQRRFRAKVLVAEDNAVNQKVVSMMLGRFGIHTDIGINGKLAAEMVTNAHDYDLVFMDVQMPVMGGHEATRRIRAHEATTGGTPIPIIAMTASATARDREACLDAGMDDFVSKPLQKKQLEAVLLRWLPQRAELAPETSANALL
jgi:PAS domain S-box-containing protein